MLFQGNNALFSTAVMFRNKAQHVSNGYSIGKCCNTVAEYHNSARRVSLFASMDCVVSVVKGITIRCKTRLAMNANKLTELGIIAMKGHWEN